MYKTGLKIAVFEDRVFNLLAKIPTVNDPEKNSLKRMWEKKMLVTHNHSALPVLHPF